MTREEQIDWRVKELIALLVRGDATSGNISELQALQAERARRMMPVRLKTHTMLSSTRRG